MKFVKNLHLFKIAPLLFLIFSPIIHVTHGARAAEEGWGIEHQEFLGWLKEAGLKEAHYQILVAQGYTDYVEIADYIKELNEDEVIEYRKNLGKAGIPPGYVMKLIKAINEEIADEKVKNQVELIVNKLIASRKIKKEEEESKGIILSIAYGAGVKYGLLKYGLLKYCKESDTIKEVKQRFIDEVSGGKQPNLKYRGVTLQDDKTLGYYDIKEVYEIQWGKKHPKIYDLTMVFGVISGISFFHKFKTFFA